MTDQNGDAFMYKTLTGIYDQLIENGVGQAAKFHPTILEDEVIRLDAITWLRANGYTVQPK